MSNLPENLFSGPSQSIQERWAEVDEYLVSTLSPPDTALDQALESSEAAELPAISVAPNQGRFLQLLARAVGATRILEVGTLGGYSTIWMARALTPGGEMVTLELNPTYAQTAQANLDRAGVGDRVEITIGPALESMANLKADGVEPFDFIFIDADKESYPEYLERAVQLSRLGSVIVIDNTVRNGEVANPNSSDERVIGTRKMHEAIATHPRLAATALQTVGSKGWDGFTLALVIS